MKPLESFHQACLVKSESWINDALVEASEKLEDIKDECNCMCFKEIP